MAQSTGEKRMGRGTLLAGILLVGAGLVLVLAPGRDGALGWLIRLWPVFLICAGVVRVMGFAIERKPRSPVGGTLLLIFGVLFLAGRFHSELNAIQIYGRYWLLLLLVFAAVELVRYYSHRDSEGPPPRLFTPWRLIVIATIVVTGVVSNRLAGANPSLLSALRLPGVLGGLRDSIVGARYAFTDSPQAVSGVDPGATVTVNNRYGNVKVVAGGSEIKATLTKGVRAWTEEEARGIAGRIKLNLERTDEGYTISTNRHELNDQFTTDIEVEVPPSAAVSITNSFGSVSARGIENDLAIDASHGSAEVANAKGRVTLSLSYSDIQASGIEGDVIVSGAKRAELNRISGAVRLAGEHGSVALRDVSGPVEVDAPFSRIDARELGGTARFSTQHSSVNVAGGGDVIIEAPHSEVRAERLSGGVEVVSSNSKIRLSSILGAVVISADRSSIAAEKLRGPVEVDTSHGEVSLKDFYQQVRVRTSYSDVSLIAAGEPRGDIDVENTHGRIRLVLPATSRFKLEATSTGGTITPVGFAGFPASQRERFFAVTDAVGPLIRLTTSFKNITILAAGVEPQASAPGSSGRMPGPSPNPGEGESSLASRRVLGRPESVRLTY